MGKILWKESFVIFLIKRVQEKEYMYNIRNSLYKNKLKKQQFWLKLVNEMNEIFKPNEPFTCAEVIKKWNNLRSYYTLGNKKFLKAKNSETSADDLDRLENSWKYQTELSFLSGTLESTASLNKYKYSFDDGFEEYPEFTNETSTETSNEMLIKQNSEKAHKVFLTKLITPATNIANEKEDVESSSSRNLRSSFSTHAKKKPKTVKSKYQYDTLEAELLTASKNLTKVIAENAVNKSGNSENQAFGLYIAAEIDKLPENIQLTSKTKVLEVVMKLRAEALKQNELKV